MSPHRIAGVKNIYNYFENFAYKHHPFIKTLRISSQPLIFLQRDENPRPQEPETNELETLSRISIEMNQDDVSPRFIKEGY